MYSVYNICEYYIEYLPRACAGVCAYQQKRSPGYARPHDAHKLRARAYSKRHIF